MRADSKSRAPALARVKDFLLGGALVSGLLSGVLGVTISRQSPGDAPEGGTPIEAGTRPAPETPEKAALAQRLIGLTGSSALALLTGVIAVSTVIETSPVRPRGVLARLLT